MRSGLGGLGGGLRRGRFPADLLPGQNLLVVMQTQIIEMQRRIAEAHRNNERRRRAAEVVSWRDIAIITFWSWLALAFTVFLCR
jgi:hypothetical protein